MIKFVNLYFIIGIICLCCYIIHDYRAYIHMFDPDEYISNFDFEDYVICLAVLTTWPFVVLAVSLMFVIRIIGRFVLMIFSKCHREEKEDD